MDGYHVEEGLTPFERLLRVAGLYLKAKASPDRWDVVDWSQPDEYWEKYYGVDTEDLRALVKVLEAEAASAAEAEEGSSR